MKKEHERDFLFLNLLKKLIFTGSISLSNTNIKNNMSNTEQVPLNHSNINIVVDEYDNILDENYLQNQFNETMT